MQGRLALRWTSGIPTAWMSSSRGRQAPCTDESPYFPRDSQRKVRAGLPLSPSLHIPTCAGDSPASRCGCFLLLFLLAPACSLGLHCFSQVLIPEGSTKVSCPNCTLTKGTGSLWVTLVVGVGAPLPLHCLLHSSLRIPCCRQLALADDVWLTAAPVASFPSPLWALSGHVSGSGVSSSPGLPALRATASAPSHSPTGGCPRTNPRGRCDNRVTAHLFEDVLGANHLLCALTKTCSTETHFQGL